MKKLFYLILLVLVWSSCGYRLYFPVNKLDDRGRKHGLWKSYWDEGKPMMKSCFYHGREYGISRTYYPSGIVVSVFKYRKDYVKVKFYDTLGNVEMKGRAKLFYDKDSTLTYFWYGKWKFFDTQHRLKEYGYYTKGKEDTVFTPKKQKRFFRFEKPSKHFYKF